VDRRQVLITGATVAGGLSSAVSVPSAASASMPHAPFRLAYAPHFGMFREHAGEDLVAQLEFIAAEGFTALEDNGMQARPVAEQERVARAMTRLGLRMGVFVAHTIGWQEANLTGGDVAMRERFLGEVRAAVAVARRVNARWMTVVPGHVDRRLDADFQTANVVEALKRAAARGTRSPTSRRATTPAARSPEPARSTTATCSGTSTRRATPVVMEHGTQAWPRG
jgi:hydroxypyruvate isomerase